jgi:cob(I)alamin adenosyltransferase
MKIYTKAGDEGKTSLIGGTRVPKSHIRIESYGTVDELNSFVGLVSDMCGNVEIQKVLNEVQDRLFTVGSHLACDPDKESAIQIPDLSEIDITNLEKEIDTMNAVLEPMRSFILPVGHSAISMTHVARCVCRRAERISVQLAELSYVDPMVIQYLNRLSDYLFVLSRKIAKDLGADEYLWIPRV